MQKAMKHAEVAAKVSPHTCVVPLDYNPDCPTVVGAWGDEASTWPATS